MHMYIIENSLKNTVIGVDLLVLHFTNRDIIFFFFSLLVVAGCIHWLMLLHQDNCTLLGQERMDNWETTDC